MKRTFGWAGARAAVCAAAAPANEVARATLRTATKTMVPRNLIAGRGRERARCSRSSVPDLPSLLRAQQVPFGKLRKRRVRLLLVPERHGRDVVLERQIPAIGTGADPTEHLHRHLQVLLEA